MKESQPTTGATPEKSFGQKKYLALFVWVAALCLSFGAYTLLVKALAHGAADPVLAPSQPRPAPDLATVMKIYPVTTYADPGATFVVTVTINDVVDLGGFEFELTYDATRLDATGVVSGTFLGSTGRTIAELGPVFGTGSVTYGAFSFGTDLGPNGDGALALVTFQATSVGTSTLHLQDQMATNTSGVLLSPSAEDGEVIVGVAAPSVTSITPNSGHVGQVLNDVLVEGEYFQVDASVQLSRTGQSPILATFVNVGSSTRISCTLNLGKAVAGEWDVVVTNPDGKRGTLEDGFTVNDPPPTISSISPDHGCRNWTVHITNLAGSNFRSGATVKLSKTSEADIAATNVVVTSVARITCDFDLTGATAGQWDVTVTNDDGQSDTLGDGFTIDACLYLPIVLKNR